MVVDDAVRIRDLKLVDHLSHCRRQVTAVFYLEIQAAAEPTSRQVEHVIDEVLHATDASKHEFDDRRSIRRAALHAPQAGLDAGERVAQVMAEHSEELLPQLGCGAFKLQSVLGRQACIHQSAFVSTSLGRGEYGQAREQQVPVVVPALDRICQYCELLAFGRDEIQRHFVEKALHPQQRREMRFVEDRAGDVKDVTQTLAEEQLA